MSKGRMNINFFLTRFVGRTKLQCENLVRELLIGSKRTGQPSIAFRALQKKFGGYKDQQLKEIQADHNAIRKEAKTGATTEFLAEFFKLTELQIESILKEGKKTIPDVQIVEVVKDDAVNAFDELMDRAEKLGPEVEPEPEEVIPEIFEEVEPDPVKPVAKKSKVKQIPAKSNGKFGLVK